MAIITLTSDWGLSDYYVGAVKGVIYSYCPQAIIVDITHNITPFDLKNAGFIVKNCYKNFPEGTIHILGIDTEESDEFSHIVVKADGHYFIGCDNGIFSIIIGDTPYEAVTIEIPQDTGYFTFSSRDRFAKVASMLASGCQLSEIGNPHNSLKIIFPLQPTYNANFIHGYVIYIDNYQNLITNISKELFDKVRNKRDFNITFTNINYVIKDILNCYRDAKDVSIMALFGSHGFLEIAINRGNASELLGLNIDSDVFVKFL